MSEIIDALGRTMRLIDAKRLPEAHLMLKMAFLMGCTSELALKTLNRTRMLQLAAHKGSN